MLNDFYLPILAYFAVGYPVTFYAFRAYRHNDKLGVPNALGVIMWVCWVGWALYLLVAFIFNFIARLFDKA